MKLPPLEETWDQISSRQVRLLPTSKYANCFEVDGLFLIVGDSPAVYAKTRSPSETNACCSAMPKTPKRIAPR